MSHKFHRKTPAPTEKRSQKQIRATGQVPAEQPPTAAWLPQENAGFVAWGQAAERASEEVRVAWVNYSPNWRDAKLRQAWEDARNLLCHTLQYAYPTGFGEGLEALLAGTSDNLEPYLAFLEADLHFFRSGYAKMKAIQGLKRIALTSAQKRRLQTVVLRVVDKGFRSEFRHYCHLARAVQTPDWLQEVETRLSSSDRHLALRARWVLEACRKK
jgi:hypothetical protein